MATKVEGLAQLKARCDLLPQVMRKKVAEAIDKGANEFADLVRSVAPVGTGGEGDAHPGVLKASVRVESLFNGLGKRVSAGGPTTTVPVRTGQSKFYDYALGVEYGHNTPRGHHVPSQPFFWPSWRVMKRRVRGRMTRAVNAAAKEVAGSGS